MRLSALFVSLLMIPILILSAPTQSGGPEGTKPNFIVILVDDLGYGGPSIYGNQRYETPEIDRLAEGGLRFTDFHSSGAVCSPTRAGLLTGLYQQRVGIEGIIHVNADHPLHHRGIRESEVTFAEVLKEFGYTTGILGKWHLGYAVETREYHPLNHGFDHFIGFLSGNIDYVSHYGDHLVHDWWHDRTETEEEGYVTHLLTKYALEFIERNKEKPFCLFLSHAAIHTPEQGPGDPVLRGPGQKSNSRPFDQVYESMTLAMDEGVGQILSKIEELDLSGQTFIFFFSDNGALPRSRTNHPTFRGHKGSAYEGGHRVPAIAWWPGQIRPGAVTDEPVISIDLMPTILSLAGVPEEKFPDLDGVSLADFLLKGDTLPERPLFWAILSNKGARSEAIREGAWKLVVQHPEAEPGTFQNETVELYNLDDDPGETVDLKEKYPERAETMLKKLKAWYIDTTRDATPQPGGW